MEVVVGLIFFILLIINLVKSGNLSDDVRNLEDEVRRLKAGAIPPVQPEQKLVELAKPEVKKDEPVAQPERKLDSERFPPNLLGIEYRTTETPVSSKTISPEPPLPALPPETTKTISESIPEEKAPPAVIRKSRTKAEWEQLIGGQWLNRIGALALIIGVGFFLKFAIDKNWINQTARVLIGGAVGLGIIAAGMHYHRKGLQIFAQGLIGAGISILYLDIYASFNFYHLIPQWVAFILMAIVTGITFWQALKYDSLAVSILGWAGGFLTPLMLSTGHANEVGLFTYIAFLAFSLMVITLRKDKWVVLEPLTFVSTYLIYFIWYHKYYNQDDLPITILYITVFWGLFYAQDIARIIKSRATYPGIRQIIAALNAILYYIAMYIMINPQHHKWMGLITLIIGAVYFVTILRLKKSNPDDKLIVPRYLLTAIALLIIATTIEFKGFNTVIFWALEALMLVWCGLRWKLNYVWQVALGIFSIAIIKMLFTANAFEFEDPQNFSIIFNKRFMAYAVTSLTLCLSAVLFQRKKEDKAGGLISEILHACWSVLVFILLTVETTDLFQKLMIAENAQLIFLEYLRPLILAAVWVVYSIALAWPGLKANIRTVIGAAYLSLAVAVLVIIPGGMCRFEPLEKFRLLLNPRAMVLVFVMALLGLHILALKNRIQSFNWAKLMVSLMHYGWTILLFILVTFETTEYFRKLLSQPHEPSEVTYYKYLFYLILAAIWAIYSIALAWPGLKKNIPAIVIPAYLALGGALLTGVIQGAAFEPIAGFTPIINIRAIIMAFIIIVCWIHTSLPKQHKYLWLIQALHYAWPVILFVLCTSEVNDWFSWYIDTKYSKSQIGIRNQAALSTGA